MILVISLMRFPAEAKIDVEQFEAEEEYTIYGFELIELGNYINSIEEKNKLLQQSLEIERENHDQAIKQANQVIEKKKLHIKRLEEYNVGLKRRNYLNHALFFAAGIGVGALF